MHALVQDADTAYAAASRQLHSGTSMQKRHAEADLLHTARSHAVSVKAHISCGCSVYMDGAAEADEPGYGPLRAWPGGLCVSRAIGDMDVGECIIAHPHIMQVQIPEEGARIVVASDGLWDCFPSRKVVKMARTKDTQQAGWCLRNGL